MDRRDFLKGLAAGTAAAGLRVGLSPARGKYVLRLVYDKSARAMRAIDTWVPLP